eukprot:gnl/TRDRNA2_/TRDRNA2_88403_c0_seq2.p1 gnl/TRDRNA2_/TRDRNA2_88403_c0~~gnl/TRDRNA2_/TRDRNA2_88403_c0_seq2.p1  ORF type:complete len:230 (-),score=10.07 gnl/TRDRNA2_/TRDRNA2_88403_c0_seq2:71-724(-)
MSHFLAHRHEPLCHPALEIWAQPRLADARLRSHSWSHRTRDSEKVSSPRAIYQNFLNRLMTSRPAERISSQHERSPRRNLGASHHMPAHDSTIAVGPHPTGLLPALTTETLQEDSHKPACDRRSSEASRREDKHEGVTLVVRNIPRTMTVAQLQEGGQQVLRIHQSYRRKSSPRLPDVLEQDQALGFPDRPAIFSEHHDGGNSGPVKEYAKVVLYED